MLTAAEAIAKLEQFHPEGILIVSHKDRDGKTDQASIVTGVAYMNVETYGLYDENEIDLSEGKDNSDFIGLPWNLTADVTIKDPNQEYPKGEDLSKYSGKGSSHLSPPTKVKDAIKMLKQRKPDALLIGFDHCDIVDIRPFDTANKILVLSWQQTGRYSDMNFTEGVNPNTIAEFVGGFTFGKKFDAERIRRRERAGMTMDARKNVKESKNFVMKFDQFIAESKKEESSVILDILKKADKPMLAVDVLKKWQKATGASSSSDDILEFYEELAKLGKKVKEKREGKNAYLSLEEEK